MRGRLIFPFVATIARIDTSTTVYDPQFKSPKVTYPGGVRTSSRKELAPVQVRCQVEDGPWEAQRQASAGNAPDTRLTLVLHYHDLELAGLVDINTGDALFRVNDRLVSIQDVRTGTLVQRVRDGVELYCTEARPIAYGIGRKRNLFLMIFDERTKGLTT